MTANSWSWFLLLSCCGANGSVCAGGYPCLRGASSKTAGLGFFCRAGGCEGWHPLPARGTEVLSLQRGALVRPAGRGCAYWPFSCRPDGTRRVGRTEETGQEAEVGAAWAVPPPCTLRLSRLSLPPPRDSRTKEVDVPYPLSRHLAGCPGQPAGGSGEAPCVSTPCVPGASLNTSHTSFPELFPLSSGAAAAHPIGEDQRGLVTFPGPHLLQLEGPVLRQDIQTLGFLTGVTSAPGTALVRVTALKITFKFFFF